MENADSAKILSTSNYKRFSLHQKNRGINLKKVDKLAAAMEQANLLHLFPIVVNKKNEILDGQHRFMAAQKVNAKLFFIVSNESYGIENVAESNSLQSHWKIEDYINYYSKSGNENYIRISDIAKKYSITTGLLCGIVRDGLSTYHKIRIGEFTFENDKEVISILDHAKQIGDDFGFNYWNSREFLRAIKYLTRVKDYSELRMIQKLQANKKLLVRCYNQFEYIQLLQEIYNLNAIKQVRFI